MYIAHILILGKDGDNHQQKLGRGRAGNPGVHKPKHIELHYVWNRYYAK